MGTFAIQIAKAHGLKTIIGTCSSKNAEYVKSLGASHVIDYEKKNIVQEIMHITAGKGVTKALDAVGGKEAKDVANSLCFEGEMVEIADIARPEEYEDRCLTFHQFSLGASYKGGPEMLTKLRAATQGFSALLEGGYINPCVTKTISLQQIPETMKAIEKRTTVGKIVAVIEQQHSAEKILCGIQDYLCGTALLHLIQGYPGPAIPFQPGCNCAMPPTL